MANYIVNLEAKEDLRRIYKYGAAKFGVQQADKYFYSFFDDFEKIAKNPYSFQSVDHIKKGYRRCPSGSDSIYYRLKDNVVEIMAIIGKQDYKPESK